MAANDCGNVKGSTELQTFKKQSDGYTACFRVPWDCSSHCCRYDMSEYVTELEDRKRILAQSNEHGGARNLLRSKILTSKHIYTRHCKFHIENGCLARFIQGLGMSDVMRDNMDLVRTPDVDLLVDNSCLDAPSTLGNQAAQHSQTRPAQGGNYFTLPSESMPQYLHIQVYMATTNPIPNFNNNLRTIGAPLRKYPMAPPPVPPAGNAGPSSQRESSNKRSHSEIGSSERSASASSHHSQDRAYDGLSAQFMASLPDAESSLTATSGPTQTQMAPDEYSLLSNNLRGIYAKAQAIPRLYNSAASQPDEVQRDIYFKRMKEIGFLLQDQSRAKTKFHTNTRPPPGFDEEEFTKNVETLGEVGQHIEALTKEVLAWLSRQPEDAQKLLGKNDTSGFMNCYWVWKTDRSRSPEERRTRWDRTVGYRPSSIERPPFREIAGHAMTMEEGGPKLKDRAP